MRTFEFVSSIHNSPMDTLDDFLIARITSYLPSPLDAPLRVTSSRFRAILDPPQKRSRAKLLEYGAEIDCADICILARDECDIAAYGNMLLIAARCGHKEICDLARKWLLENRAQISQADMVSATIQGGHLALCEYIFSWYDEPPDYNWMLDIAAQYGHRAICEYARANMLKRNMVPRYDLMLSMAARGDHRDICELAISWGARINNPMLFGAAYGGHRDMCALAREWILNAGILPDYYHALACAALGGHYEICMLIREWIGGPCYCHEMLYNAVCGGHLAICELAHEWAHISRIRARYSSALDIAAYHGHRAMMHTLRDWANSDGELINYHLALESACAGGHVDLCKLVLEWMRDANEIPNYNALFADATTANDTTACSILRNLARADGVQV